MLAKGTLTPPLGNIKAHMVLMVILGRWKYKLLECWSAER